MDLTDLLSEDSMDTEEDSIEYETQNFSDYSEETASEVGASDVEEYDLRRRRDIYYGETRRQLITDFLRARDN